MALQKTFLLPDGHSSNYIRFNRVAVMDRTQRVAVIWFDLFKDAATAATLGAKPHVADAFRLVAADAAYDAWFSNAALAAATHDIVAQAYAAAKVLPLDWWNGHAPLADAVDV